MLQHVGDGLLGNSQQMLLEFLRKAVLRAGNIDVHLHARSGRPQLRAGVERGGQVLPFQHRRAQVHYGAPRFGQAMAGHFAREVQILFRLAAIIRRHRHRDRVELRTDADETLCQSVMNLSRQARAFFQDQREPRGELPQTQLVQTPGGRRQRQRRQHPEPRGLVKLRQHFELVNALRCRTAGQFGAHAETITTMPEAVVVDDPPVPCPDPVGIQSFQLVRVLDPLGRAEVNGGVADLNALAAGREPRGFGVVDAMAVHEHINQMQRRRRFGLPVRMWIDDGKPAAGREPQTPVARAAAAAGYRIAGRALRAAQPVFHSVVGRLQHADLVFFESVQLAFRNPADAARNASCTLSKNTRSACCSRPTTEWKTGCAARSARPAIRYPAAAAARATGVCGSRPAAGLPSSIHMRTGRPNRRRRCIWLICSWTAIASTTPKPRGSRPAASAFKSATPPFTSARPSGSSTRTSWKDWMPTGSGQGTGGSSTTTASGMVVIVSACAPNCPAVRQRSAFTSSKCCRNFTRPRGSGCCRRWRWRRPPGVCPSCVCGSSPRGSRWSWKNARAWRERFMTLWHKVSSASVRSSTRSRWRCRLMIAARRNSIWTSRAKWPAIA